MSNETIFINGLYQHYKGKFYIVLELCKMTETNEIGVLYYQVGNPELTYCRPVSSFIENVEDKKRFKYIGATRNK
jgi:hypothetical protein